MEHVRSDEGFKGDGPSLAPAPHVSCAAEERFDEARIDFDVGVELEVTEYLTAELGSFVRF